MIADIEKLLAARPFVPFTIVTSAGMRYHVASADHINITPRKSRVVVLFDDDTGVFISGLHITAIEAGQPQVA